MIRRFTLTTSPPSNNAQKACVNGRLIKTKVYRDWEDLALAELTNQPGFSGEFFWRSCIHFPPSLSRMDVDNAPKPIHDILVTAGKVPDDRFLADSRIRWANGDKIIVAIQKEDLDKWQMIRKLSNGVIQRLAKSYR